MPVLVNTQSGLAENLPQEAANTALQQGTHQLPLNDPQGNPVTAGLDQARDLLAQGYTQPSDEQHQSLLDYAKYSSPIEQIKTALEGAAEAATFGGSTAAEIAGGADKDAIRARRETNPGLHTIGQIGGLAASSLIPEVGEANVMKALGEGVAGLSGIGNATIGGRLGSQFIKNAAETALMQSGDEFSKMITSEPGQGVGSVAANIGLSGVLGGVMGAGLGVIPEAWKATFGKKLGSTLSALQSRVTSGDPVPEAMEIARLGQQAGVPLKPEMIGSLMSDPTARRAAEELMVTEGTWGGRGENSALQEMRENTQKSILDSIGKTPEDIDAIASGQRSIYTEGGNAKQALTEELTDKFSPLEKRYNDLTEGFGKMDLHPSQSKYLADNLVSLWKQKFAELPNSEGSEILQKAITDIGPIKTVEGMRGLQSDVLGKIWDAHVPGLYREARTLFDDAIDNAISTQLTDTGKIDVLNEFNGLRREYSTAKNKLDSLAEEIRPGKYRGVGTFIRGMKDLSNEDLLKRVSVKDNAEFSNLIQSDFPKTAEIAKDAHLNDLLRSSISKGEIDPRKLFNKLYSEKGAWSPELRKSVLGDEAEKKIIASKQLFDRIPTPRNSGTPGMIDRLNRWAPAGKGTAIGGLIGTLTGHGPLGAGVGWLAGQIQRLVGREAPDALKLTLLKFLGSTEPIDAEGFKTAFDFIRHASKGEQLANAAVKSIFRVSDQKGEGPIFPDEKKNKKLDNQLKQFQQNPDPLIDIGGKTPHYLPDHGQALGQLAATSVNYLNSIRPESTPQGPLGEPLPPTKIQDAQYERALTIANQPLVVIHSLKEGTISTQDVQHLKTLYPGLYSRLSQKLLNQAVEYRSKGDMIPYKTILSMGIFLGQDMDASTFQQNIAFNQTALSGGGQAQAANQMNQKIKTSQKGLSSITKAQQIMTPMQASAQRGERA
jgi:hypothetical protein